MKLSISLRYLNSILTVIAILLTFNLVTLWTAPSGAGGGYGMGLDGATHAYGAKQPTSPLNAAAQRKDNLDELRAINKNMTSLVRLFRSGQARVKVESMPRGRD